MTYYDRWLNSLGTTMYHFVFSFIKDKDGSGVMTDVRMRDNEIDDYTIMGNIDDKFVARPHNKVVTDSKKLKALNKLPLKYDLIKWIFAGKTYYHPWGDNG